ncbi:MAG: glutamate-5-semialdehyde dehydrogenase [Campylobacterota bacterium]|nr:glutamate-5-semialdehyde dehydrogenase [Campylobacterota bacterium]
MEQFLKEAKESSSILSTLSGDIKNKVLNDMADALISNIDLIVVENKLDIRSGEANDLSSALMDRLLLNKERIEAMAKAIREIASAKDPLGKTLEGWVTPTNLNIQKVSVPIGVVGIIYESRPNVTSDTAALCFKSGNVCILKGGKEAQYSNAIIAEVLQQVLIKNDLPKNIISLLPDSSREGVANLIKQDQYLDLIIPRGGEALIKYISSNSSVPVIKHDKGLCHTYIHKDADFTKAIDVSINAKCRRAGICGAMETLLIDENVASKLLPKLKEQFDKHSTLLKGCSKTMKIIDVVEATQEDFDTEYLDNILSIKVVSNLEEAIKHIRQYSSSHSDAIITENCTDAELFLNSVDSACVYLNASTQFTDGGEFGFGAEVGISTNKLHARGPMGIDGLTTYKFKILGSGQTRK